MGDVYIYDNGATVKIKPLSVNECWQGKRFKTPAYKSYEIALGLMLPQIKLPAPPFEISFTFGFSNLGADIDNPVKPLLDIMQKKYKFNDSQVSKLTIEKVKVAKGSEWINFEIYHYNEAR